MRVRGPEQSASEKPEENKLESAIVDYINKGILHEQYSSIEELKKNLKLLGDERAIENFSDSLRMHYLPVNELYSAGYACNKFLSKDIYTSGVAGGISGGASYFCGAPFLLIGLTGGSGFLLSSLLLFSYRMHRRSVEGYEKIYRFDEIFSNVPPVKDRTCLRMSPFSGR